MHDTYHFNYEDIMSTFGFNVVWFGLIHYSAF